MLKNANGLPMSLTDKQRRVENASEKAHICRYPDVRQIVLADLRALESVLGNAPIGAEG